jgi:(p)ppGpp synthase/HD superfamily hydrolase
MTHPDIFDTILWAVHLHDEQFDKAGVPYITHPLAVMRMVPEQAWHVAVLHDALEDCHITREDLNARGYSADEIAAIDLLTRLPPYEYEPYIERIATSGNYLAICTKIADLEDNLDPKRCAKLNGPDAVKRETKYKKALARLRLALP